ncbi:tRNA (5-methylaminomethyl-2-thiouridylate)-methyltransferase [Fusobacterium necrophorum]|uniref:tRNA (5-methylaminomethyl-2-thiouridylate)-methyltransferase n=1 Tax=Fusobacterium necrophorum TaxID=859 RepID=A0A4Q2KUF8_9FUSO|nr:7-cyano-7-deazaguanine synthase [Fusobacterium necrophorum]RXZ69174.1 tRNA (5-methylaminomethyl-2-thiouridylate)-methyltransferase [Fusobacterium necrophorum]
MSKIKALALFSGGLDSALAIKIVQEQGIEVIALNFVSHFFGGANEKAEYMAKQLGISLEYIHFEERHMEIVKAPVYGRGKNMNPCIDCHSLMFRVAGELLEKYGASFLISGEVLGQRPMSQNPQALEKVKKLSGVGDLILRPLSGKLLPPSLAETKGWIRREGLLDINGRGRSRQMELMAQYGLVDYPSPGGGCLLTDPAYSVRLKVLEADGLLQHEYADLFSLIKISRFFRFAKGKYLFVGRDEISNEKIDEIRRERESSFYIYSFETPGPHMLGFGELTEEEKNFSRKLFSRYSKVKGKEEIKLNVSGVVETLAPISVEAMEEEMKKYQL